MGKKVDRKQEKAQAKQQAKVEEEPIIDEVALHGEEEESLTIKQKKENYAKMVKSVKKMNKKLSKSLDKKLVIKAVQALK